MSARNDKKAQFQQTEKKSSGLLIPIVLVVIVALAAGAWFFVAGGSAGGPQQVKANSDGTVRLTADAFADGNARYFRYQGKQGAIDFFLVKSQDGVIRAAFDSCDVCYKEKKGYRQEGNKMVCNNCDMAFRTDMINQVKGGCNPAPLERNLVGNEIVIRVAALERGDRYFNFQIN